MIEYESIQDRYGSPLKQPDKKPTVEQSVFSWALVNELMSLGYLHNFQHERSDIVDYIYEVSAIIDKAIKIAEVHHD